MMQIPDAPWVQNPEPYIDQYYGLGPDEEDEDK